MADASEWTDEPIRWRSDDYPRGTVQTEAEVLSADQQRALEEMKQRTRRQDVRYLRDHPEIRAITALLTQVLMSERPTIPIRQFCARFFSRPREQIEEDLVPFLEKEMTCVKVASESLLPEPSLISDFDRDADSVSITSSEMAFLFNDISIYKKLSAADKNKVLIKLKQADLMTDGLEEETNSMRFHSIVFQRSIEDFIKEIHLQRVKEKAKSKAADHEDVEEVDETEEGVEDEEGSDRGDHRAEHWEPQLSDVAEESDHGEP